MNNNHYITLRIINTCLRENVNGLLSRAEIATQPPQSALPVVSGSTPNLATGHWLTTVFGNTTLLLNIEPYQYMQDWQATTPYWFIKENDQWHREEGYDAWLNRLATGLDKDTKALFDNYRQEAQCAELHRGYCQNAYKEQTKKLSAPISELETWSDRLILADQIASYLDHPYYPTARAKFGFDQDALFSFAPEFNPTFALRWFAIDKNLAEQTSTPPACWPSMSDVGLPDDFEQSHVLFPIHPLTWETFTALPEGIIKAPLEALLVKPTLSVRTVVAIDAPHIHIKVPLVMRTLGTKNIRFIKPSTMYDGHWFERLLTRLELTDSELSGLYLHCEEKHGGHVADDKRLAYIVREYPEGLQQDKTLVPVAALCSPMPDQRLFLEHLAKQYFDGDVLGWFDDYIALLVRVHLTLWLKYGIALESNQQNAVLVYGANKHLTLAMKDNDAARIWPERFSATFEQHQFNENDLIDKRILVDDELALAQMFTTITLQLDIAAIIEPMAQQGLATTSELYRKLKATLVEELERQELLGRDIDCAHRTLLEDTHLYAKYLLTSGSLLSKEKSGAADINKFYGKTAPNFLHQA